MSDEPPASVAAGITAELQRGRTQQAEQTLRQYLARANGSEICETAISLARGGQLPWARQCILRAMELEPSNPKFLLAASNIAQDLCEDDEALELAHAAMVADPAGAEVHCHAGVLHLLKGDLETAEAAFVKATSLKPGYVRALTNLAAVRIRQRKFEGAVAASREAVRRAPDDPSVNTMLGNSLLVAGNGAEAEVVLKQLLDRNPESADACLLLTSYYFRLRSTEECVGIIQRTLRHVPDRADLWGQLGDALAELDFETGAAQAYARACALEPGNIAWAARSATLLPRIPRNVEHIAQARARLTVEVRKLWAEAPKMLTSWPEVNPNTMLQTAFYLGYQGLDDREIQKQYAAVATLALEAKLPRFFEPLPARPPKQAGDRIRIGFAGRHLYLSTVGNYFASWITDLPTDRFVTFVYSSSLVDDELSRRLASRAAGSYRTDGSVEDFAARIRADDLDILVYPELGMDQMFYMLASLRLAPLQLCAWGHPVTPGHANIDGYVSCAEMEPHDASDHYNEPLHLLPGIGTNYALPARPPGTARRADYQLPDDRTLMLVPQSLFKIHPDNDSVVVEILRASPKTVAVLFAGQNRPVTQHFVARLSAAFAKAGLATDGRVKILPVVDHAHYKIINALCDFMLDTLHWSGGNTTLDALSVGLPVVTLPGRFMRGRQSTAMLRILGMDELIADSREALIDRAIRLTTDNAWRESLRSRILAARHKLFDDPAPVCALATLLETLHAARQDVHRQETSARR